MNKNLKFLGYLLLNINQIRSSYRKKKTIFQKARHNHSLNIYIIYIAYKLLLKFYFPIERQPTFQKARVQMNFFGKSRCHECSHSSIKNISLHLSLLWLREGIIMSWKFDIFFNFKTIIFLTCLMS